MAGLDKPSDGKVLFEEQDLADMNEQELTDLRRHRIGFIFQSFGLLPLLSAFENVELPLRIRGCPQERERSARGRHWISWGFGRARGTGHTSFRW